MNEEEQNMIGVIGLGAMGSGMAVTLLREFRDVLVYDVDEARLGRIVRAGAREGSGAADVAARCDTVLLSLPSSPVTERVIRDDVAPAVAEGAIVIDTGTTRVAATRELAGLLADRGARLLDAPVSGGSVGTAKGALYCFVGGDRETAAAAWPLLRLLAKARLTYCGPSGAGQIVKGVNQLAMGLLNAAMVESVAYGVASGVDQAVLLEAVGGNGGFRSTFEGVASTIAAGLGDSINYKYTEYDYFLEQADSVGFAAPIVRSLKEYLVSYPHDQIDNINRAHPSLWGALIGSKEPDS